MINTNELILGIDIANKYSQISYYDEKNQTVESIPIKGKVLLFENPVPLEKIFEGNKPDIPVLMDELNQLIGALLDTAKKFRNAVHAKMLCVTVENFNVVILDSLKKSFSFYGYESNNIKFISHEESYAYYAFGTKKGMCGVRTVLFEYGSVLNAYLLSCIKIRGKEVIAEERYHIEDEKLNRVLSGECDLSEVEEILLKFSKQIINGKNVSAVYLTGMGFDTEDFPKTLLKFLCDRRKVFAGQNLFVKGACLAAYEYLHPTRYMDTVFACNHRITTGIELQINERGKEKRFKVVKPGVNWYDAERTISLILDECDKIVLYMIPLADGQEYMEVIDLDTIPYRLDKTTRISVHFKFISDEICQITVRDRGFGEIAVSSGKVIYKEIHL